MGREREREREREEKRKPKNNKIRTTRYGLFKKRRVCEEKARTKIRRKGTTQTNP